MQDGRPMALGASDIRRLVLQNQRQAMNSGGGVFDTVGNRSRYDQSMERGQQIAQQQNDIGMRERMQGRDLSTQMAMQGNDIQSRYGLAAQQAKIRERQAAQEFGQSMARLNAEFGFKAGESDKERSHVKTMADFEAQLREVASSNDFRRGLEKLAVEYGMSKEQATTAFERMLEGKQVDHSNAVDMVGVKSRYDMLGNDQKFGHDQQINQQQFGFDTQKQQQSSDLALRNQGQYWDRYRDENQALNEQKFTQQQQQAMQEINRRKDEQFEMALNEARGRSDNLNPHGQQLLREIEDGVAEIEATRASGRFDENEVRAAKQTLLGKIGQIMQPQLLQSKIQSIDPEGRVKGWYDQKKEWRELPPPNANAVEPIPPEIAQRGGILRGPDGQPMQYISPQKPTSAAEIDPTIRRDEWISERLKQKTNDPLNPGGRYVTPQEAVAEWKQIQQAFAEPSPVQQQALQQIDARGYSDRPATEAEMRQGIPQRGQQQGMMQRGPQAQPPRPQNMMPNQAQGFQQAGMQGGQPNQQQPPANPQVPVEVQNAARFVRQIAAQYPDPNAMPPEVQRALEQALSIARQFNSGGR